MINTRLFALIALLLVSINKSIAQVGSQQEMTVHLDLLNPSSEINDGIAIVTVEGGAAPYQYKWSNINTHLYSAESIGMLLLPWEFMIR